MWYGLSVLLRWYVVIVSASHLSMSKSGILGTSSSVVASLSASSASISTSTILCTATLVSIICCPKFGVVVCSAYFVVYRIVDTVGFGMAVVIARMVVVEGVDYTVESPPSMSRIVAEVSYVG
uniref:Uncharacterized protein n=1 Tax=Eucampia antarctica TaxID=49252 RepID=A0A7S2WJT2_9STRA